MAIRKGGENHLSTLINEQKMIEDNILLYEQKLKSPIRRFIDKSFVPVRYWHVKSKDTTVDKGYGDVAEILGKDSPIKFQLIENLPLYGLDQMILQLNTSDQGLDSSFESEATIMEGTIRPLENDYFMIPHLKDSYIFRVTAVDYDMVASDQSYKISFVLEYIDNEKVEDLKTQTKNEFTCVMENIGTDERCIIEKSDHELLEKIDTMYNEIVNTFLTFYYNERYNCLLADFEDGKKLYDPFMSDFIMEHQLFRKKNSIDNLVLTEQFGDAKRKIKYQKSIYRFFETRKMDMLTEFPYTTFYGRTNEQTAFYRWLDNSVMVVDIPRQMDPVNHYHIMDGEFVDVIRLNGPTHTVYQKLIKQFARKEDMTIHDIDLSLSEEILSLDEANLEVYFYVPIILYIIKTIVSDHLDKKKTMDGLEVVEE